MHEGLLVKLGGVVDVVLTIVVVVVEGGFGVVVVVETVFGVVVVVDTDGLNVVVETVDGPHVGTVELTLTVVVPVITVVSGGLTSVVVFGVGGFVLDFGVYFVPLVST